MTSASETASIVGLEDVERRFAGAEGRPGRRRWRS